MKQVVMSLDTAKELYKQGGAGKMFALENYTEEEINKKKLPKTFGELGLINGFFVESDGNLRIGNVHSLNGNGLLPTKELAKAVIALCKLLFLRDAYNGNWKADWKNEDIKYSIFFNYDIIEGYWGKHKSYILNFKTSQIRDEFLDNFRDLIEEAKELL